MKDYKDYDYREAMAEDICAYIKENGGVSTKSEEEWWDDMFISDQVTGNASGSYTFSTYRAEEYVCHNLDLLVEACNEFGQDVGECIEKGAENADVTIRCYLLGEVLSEVLSEMAEEED